ncbi:MAG: S9 family peptidase [Acidobacteria bacterium]|nr:S9 family peptidase [Acidobacteriota bacterium]
MTQSRRLPSRVCLLLAVALTLCVGLAQNGSKRPLTHKDYDSWKTIASQRLSDDGRYLAYQMTPQDGDSEIVLRNLGSGTERRFPAGSRPTTRSSESESGEPGPAAGPAGAARGSQIAFTSDGKYLIFTTLPSKADQEKARKERKGPADQPKGALRIVPTEAGEEITVSAVRSFQTAADAPQWIAWLKEPEPSRDQPAATKSGESKQDQRGGARGGAAAAAGGRRPEYGSDLTLRNLQGGEEFKFVDVTEYSLAKDGKTLAFTRGSRKDETNGFYAAPTEGGEPKAILAGKGRYEKITWDEKQTQAVFLSTKDDAAARQPKYKLYHWARNADTAQPIVNAEMDGLPKGWTISERGALSFAKDASRVFFATAPARAERRPVATGATPAPEDDDKVTADLWHWKDDNVQPMQKVRAEQERNRSYRAVYSIASKRVVQLADNTMPDVNLTEDSKWGIGSDDREYRQLVEYDERRSDLYLVNTDSGSRRLLLRRHRGSLSPSPNNEWAVTFDGKNWLSVELNGGRVRNLTESLQVAFANEDFDMPGTRNAYGVAGWTKDAKHVLLYDRYDIWQVAPDGSSAKLLTDGVGRRENLQFRYVRLADEEDPPGPALGPSAALAAGFNPGGSSRLSIDPAKPMLLRTENLKTRETGFYEDKVDGTEPPRKLTMAAKSFSAPLKAKKADVLVLTASRFDEFGDLWTSDTKFSNLRKVSNANPQQAAFRWGTAELVRFQNLDGVTLSAVLHKPENFDPGKKYPMIVYIYERLSQGLHRYVAPAPGTSINVTYYTSNGYLVLQPDIIYTAGYPGQSALKCVLPAIQAVANQGFVKEDSVGIQGHSWGGYQIAYMVTQTNRFKAAAAGAVVANMISAYDGIRWGTGLPRQFQYERSQSRIGGSIWQYPTRFMENSPIFWADRVQTPLLMVHNDGDDAVPWYQGIEYFLALRRLGREVYMFNYNGEPHGLRRRPNQKDYTMRMQQFFDYHLKGAAKPEWMEKGIPYLERETEKDKWKPVKEAPTASGAAVQ